MPVLVVCHAERSPASTMKREVSYQDRRAATGRALKLPAREPGMFACPRRTNKSMCVYQLRS